MAVVALWFNPSVSKKNIINHLVYTLIVDTWKLLSVVASNTVGGGFMCTG